MLASNDLPFCLAPWRSWTARAVEQMRVFPPIATQPEQTVHRVQMVSSMSSADGLHEKGIVESMKLRQRSMIVQERVASQKNATQEQCLPQ